MNVQDVVHRVTSYGRKVDSKKLYWFSMGMFSCLEMMAVYQLYFWKSCDNESGGGYMMNRSNINIWKNSMKHNKEMINLVDWYSMWVANNKFILITLGCVIGYNGDLKTRFYGSLAMALGCGIYFIKMSQLLHKMQQNGELIDSRDNNQPNLAHYNDIAIGGTLLPLWLCTAAVSGIHLFTQVTLIE